MPITKLVRITTVVLLVLCGACSRSREVEPGKWRVVAVADGDTITVLDSAHKQHGVRLQGIDAPERAQAFGDASRQHLNDLVFGRDVILEGDKTDKYGRMLCKVLVDGRDANLEQIESGCAWFYRHYENDLSRADRASYESAESQARAAFTGLWRAPEPTPPWEYRHPDDGTDARGPEFGKSTNGPAGSVIGNRRSRIYFWSACPDYGKISPHNREYFSSREDAEKAGYRAAHNCN